MKFAAHVFSAVAATSGTYVMLAPSDPRAGVLAGAFVFLGAIAPDLDHPNTAAARRLPLLHALYIALILGPTRLLSGKRLGRRLEGHRALTHSLLGTLLLTSAAAGGMYGMLWLLARAPFALSAAAVLPAHPVATAAAGMLAGIALHLLLDAPTKSGIPLLLPWRTKGFHLLPKRHRVRMDTSYFAERQK